MRALKSKVAKMEGKRRAESEAGLDDHRRMMHMLNSAMVAHQPGLEQVRPEHTDPETYRDIQETLAWARGDYDGAERIGDAKPHDAEEPADWNGLSPADSRRLVQQTLSGCASDAHEKTERMQAAALAATRAVA